MAGTEPRLSVDVGTSTTVAVLAWGGQVRTLLFDGSPQLPSAVCLDVDGALLTGRDALHAARARPGCLEPYPKRCLDQGTVLLGTREVPATDLIAAVLRRVFTEAAQVTGGVVPPVVLTHPVGWGTSRRAALVAAARSAGGRPIGTVAEPLAAASYLAAAGRLELDPGRYGLVYDIGAGTVDVTLVRPDRADGRVTVLASTGMTDVGGLDIDAAVVEYLGGLLAARAPDRWAGLMRAASDADRRARLRLWADVRAGKESLSRTATTLVPVPYLDDALPLGREQLDELARPLLERTVREVRRLTRSAGLAGAPPQQVFLVGGASRMPLVATMLHRALRIAPTTVEQPEIVVAEGALHADLHEGDLHEGEVDEGCLGATSPVAVAAPTAPPARSGRPRSRVALVAAAVTAAATLAAVAAWQPWQGGTGRAGAGAGSPAASMRPAGASGTAAGSGAGAGASAGSGAASATPGDPVVGTAATALPAPVAGLAGYENVLFRPGAGAQMVGSRGAEAMVWDVTAGAPVARLTGAPGTIEELAFSPDGAQLAALTDGAHLIVWNVATRQRTAEYTLTAFTGSPVPGAGAGAPTGVVRPVGKVTLGTDLVYTPDGRGLLLRGANAVERWDAATLAHQGVAVEERREPLASFRIGAGGRFAVGNLLLSRRFDVWDVPRRSRLTTIGQDVSAVPAIQRDGTLVAIPGSQGVRLWDAATGTTQAQLPLPDAKQRTWVGVQFTPDGRYLWSGQELWDVQQRRILVPAFAGASAATDAQFSSDGRFLALRLASSTYVWDLTAVLGQGG